MKSRKKKSQEPDVRPSLDLPYDSVDFFDFRRGIYDRASDTVLVPQRGLMPPLFYPKWTFDRFMEATVLVLWLVVLWPGWIGKYFEERDRPYAEYLTNWSFTLQALGWTLKLVSYFDTSGRLLHVWYLVVWWPLSSLTFGVFVLVAFVLEDSPVLLTGPFKTYGAGTVMLANTIYHYVPPMVVFWSLYMTGVELQQMAWVSKKGAWLHYIWNVCLAHIPVMLYGSIYNFAEVYGLKNIRWWWILILYEMGCTLMWTTVIFLASYLSDNRTGASGLYNLEAIAKNLTWKRQPASSPAAHGRKLAIHVEGESGGPRSGAPLYVSI